MLRGKHKTHHALTILKPHLTLFPPYIHSPFPPCSPGEEGAQGYDCFSSQTWLEEMAQKNTLTTTQTPCSSADTPWSLNSHLSSHTHPTAVFDP